MADNCLTLNCLIKNEHAQRPSIFEVEVPVDAKVVRLQRRIKDEKGVELGSYDADSLVLWKVSWP